MKLSHACGYAVYAVVHLARHKGPELVTSQKIAVAQGIPEGFMVKVLRPLVSARVLFSLKGPNGGYRLARAAKDISLLEIVEAVDGPLHGQVPHFQSDGAAKIDRRLEAVCKTTADLIRDSFEKVTIADLVSRSR